VVERGDAVTKVLEQDVEDCGVLLLDFFAHGHENRAAVPVALDEADARAVAKPEVGMLAADLAGIGISQSRRRGQG
jgi:hypothetical protein